MGKPLKMPRPGSRVRAVFEALLRNRIFYQDGVTFWKQAKFAYDDSHPAYTDDQRAYSSMEVSRILRKYADRVGRGRYVMKPEWVDLAIQGKQPTSLVLDVVEPAPAEKGTVGPSDPQFVHLRQELDRANGLVARLYERIDAAKNDLEAARQRAAQALAELGSLLECPLGDIQERIALIQRLLVDTRNAKTKEGK